jgi:hypothetical protein
VDYAHTADRYLVAFRYIWDLDGTSQIQARAYLSNGTPEDYAFEVSPQSDNTKFPEQPDLAYNRSRDEFLVVWQQEFSATDRDIWARWITMSGGAATHNNAFAVSTSTDDDVNPAIAAIATVLGEGEYLVAWTSDSGSDKNVNTRTVAGDGTSVSFVQTPAGTGWSEHSPAVAGCESNQQFLAVWVWIPAPTAPMMQVQARTLDLNSNFLDSTTTVGGGQVFETAIAAGPAGDFLMAFDDNEVIGVSNRGIYGHLWGNRVYLPLILRNH